MISMPELTQAELAESIELAKAALDEITEFSFVGDFHEVVDEGDGVYALRFVSDSPGFRDWWWTVTLTRVSDADAPTVLECGLLPGEDALLAPEWVPWAKRLARFRATHDSHGNPLPEGEGEDGDQPAETPRVRTRKRTRTRLRRRGETAIAETGKADSGETTGEEANDSAESLPIAADIRDYAEEMDDALDGVTFEDGESEEDR